jgi:hypothetical protein
MEPELRYSDRKRVAETGSLGPLAFDTVPEGFRIALASVLDEAESRYAIVKWPFRNGLDSHCRQHFGWSENWFPSAYWLVQDATTDQVLDFVEILVEEATKTYSFVERGGFQAFAEIEDRLNRLFVALLLFPWVDVSACAGRTPLAA